MAYVCWYVVCVHVYYCRHTMAVFYRTMFGKLVECAKCLTTPKSSDSIAVSIIFFVTQLIIF